VAYKGITHGFIHLYTIQSNDLFHIPDQRTPWTCVPICKVIDPPMSGRSTFGRARDRYDMKRLVLVKEQHSAGGCAVIAVEEDTT
jgi:hypothetical protein